MTSGAGKGLGLKRQAGSSRSRRLLDMQIDRRRPLRPRRKRDRGQPALVDGLLAQVDLHPIHPCQQSEARGAPAPIAAPRRKDGIRRDKVVAPRAVDVLQNVEICGRKSK